MCGIAGHRRAIDRETLTEGDPARSDERARGQRNGQMTAWCALTALTADRSASDRPGIQAVGCFVVSDLRS
jgi:hypothetical protein